MDPENLNAEANNERDTPEQAAERAAFEGAFSSDDDGMRAPGDEPRDKPADVVAAAPAPAAEPAVAAVEVDPFASLPPAMKDLLARVPTMEHDMKTTMGRVSALQRENEALRRQLTQAPAASPAPAPAPAEPTELDEVRAVREQGLPEVADAIQAAVRNAMKAAAPAPKPAEAAPAASAPAPASAEDPRLQAEADALSSLQPDWAPKMNSADFKLWLGTQGQDVQERVLTTDRAIVVLDALTKFDRHRQAVGSAADQAARLAGKRNARAAAAVTPVRGGASAPPSQATDENAAFLQAFNE